MILPTSISCRSNARCSPRRKCRKRSARDTRRDTGHTQIHGPVARGERARCRGGARRDRRAAIRDEDIGSQWSLWSGRASCSAGIELAGHEIVVLGMSRQWSGDLAIDHAVMTDAIDIEPVRAAMTRLGLGAPGQILNADRDRMVAMLAKAEPSHDGRLRGNRHTMLDDSDISSTRHARAFVCGALAGTRRPRRNLCFRRRRASGPGRRRPGCDHREASQYRSITERSMPNRSARDTERQSGSARNRLVNARMGNALMQH